MIKNKGAKVTPSRTPALLLFAMLAACVGPTGYKAKGVWSPTYGYSDKKIADDEYSVAATGNWKTSKARAAEISLLRAAHLTLEQGRTHFLIVKQKAEVLEAIDTIFLPVPMGGLLLAVPVASRSSGEPTAVLIIKLMSNESASSSPDALEAAAVIQQLAQRLD